MPVLDYAFNYDYIVENLCENRANPELMCNGRCYLSKEIAKHSDHSSKQEISNINLHIDTFVAGEIYRFRDFSMEVDEDKKVPKQISFLYRFSLFKNIFHPPLA